MHHTFLHIALLFMYDYDVKLSNCTFYIKDETTTTGY